MVFCVCRYVCAVMCLWLIGSHGGDHDFQSISHDDLTLLCALACQPSTAALKWQRLCRRCCALRCAMLSPRSVDWNAQFYHDLARINCAWACGGSSPEFESSMLDRGWKKYCVLQRRRYIFHLSRTMRNSIALTQSYGSYAFQL